MNFSTVPEPKFANEPFRVLNGWKEIAAYVGRGVRTVQRWEKLGLPVRRPNAHLRSAVLTSTADIDAWMRRCSDGRGAAPLGDSRYDQLAAQIAELRMENEHLRREVDVLNRRVQQIQPARPAPPDAAQQHAA